MTKVCVRERERAKTQNEKVKANDTHYVFINKQRIESGQKFLNRFESKKNQQTVFSKVNGTN